MSFWEKFWGVALLGCFFAGVFLSHMAPPFYENIWVIEDGPIESLTALALALGFALTFSRASRLSSLKTFSRTAFFWGFPLIFFFGFMEEISWGQRIIQSFIDFELPEFFKKHNVQGETNLHNLRFNNIKVNKIVFGMAMHLSFGFYVLVLPLLGKRWPKINIFLPLSQKIHQIIYLILLGGIGVMSHSRKWEMLEFGECWLLFFIFLSPSNRDILLSPSERAPQKR